VNDEEPTNWQDVWNAHAASEKGSLDQTPVADLIEQVRQGWYGNYYHIWYSIAGRAPLADFLPAFLAVLHSDVDYLYRYHCAQALLESIPETGLQPVDLSGDHSGRPERLARFEGLLRERGLLPSAGAPDA
jgi:hypothetical protein